MSKEDRFEVEGVVIDVLPGSKFKVQLENGHVCTCTLSGKIRTNYIKIIKGDNVTIDLPIQGDSSFSNGRIIYRNK